MEERVFIIRWTENIRFPGGEISNMACRKGTRQEVEEYAEQMARDHHVEVVAIT